MHLAEEELAAADAVLKAHGRTFHWARRFLGQRHAVRATLLYSFCRFVDDAADEASSEDEARATLAAIRDDLQRERPTLAEVRGARAVLGAHPVGRQAALDLLAGVEGDLDEVAFATVEDLIQYAYRVAGTVGLMMCLALDQHDPAAFPHAVDLGIAMQLTNIARDIHEDATLGRRYLPAELVGDLAPARIRQPGAEERARLVAARQALVAAAEPYYQSGERGLCFLPLGARFAILAASRSYRAIGPRAVALGERLDVRARVGGLSKAGISLGAFASQPLSPGFWRRPCAHDASLHGALADLEVTSAWGAGHA